jgi:hypothetical protein
MSHFLHRAFAGSAIAVLLLARTAEAQPAHPPPAVPAPASDPQPSGNAEAEARAHFNTGNKHFDKGEYREAYDEFRKSLALMKTRAVMAAAASSLKQLGRYDEALDLYEQVRRDFPNLPPTLEAKVAPAIAELQGLVGTLAIAGDAPAGASLFVDDRLRGKLPLAEPLRIAVGSHQIRVEKEGFDPITATAEVSPRQKSVAELRAKSRMGRLEVREKHNWVLEVELDGKNVGKTPWEGMVEPGAHRVRLHGLVGLDALAECAAPEPGPGGTQAAREGAKMGSPPVTATVRLYEVTPLVLGAEELDASLRIESAPSGATLAIDSKPAGRTPWEGRLGLGEHTIEVTAGGFLPAKERLRLERRKQRELQVVLERKPLGEPDMAGVRLVRNVGVGVAYGIGAAGLGVFAVTGILALNETGAIRSRCGGTRCPASEQPSLNAVRSIGTASTAGLIVGGIGVVTGTVILFAVRLRAPERHATTGGVTWKAGVGPGQLALEARF